MAANLVANATDFVVSWTLNRKLTFVKPLPDHMEVYCKKCGNFMRTPYQTKCCVKHVCKDCHTSLMANRYSRAYCQEYGRKCPHCSNTAYDAFEDRFYQWHLRALEVCCINKGCRWSGKLEDLSTHLNYREKKDLFWRYEGCDYTKIKCKHDACRNYYLERKSLKEHEEKCKHRPHICPYCWIYSNTFLQVELHYNTICSKFPVPCSNEGHVNFKIERGKLKNHLDNECPFQPIECEFKWAGCNDRPKRKDTDEHNTSNQQKHLLLLAKACGELKKDNEALKKDNEALKQDSEALKQDGEALKQDGEALKQDSEALKKDNKALKLELNEAKRKLESQDRLIQSLDHTVYGDLPVTGDERNPVRVEGNGIPVFFFSNNHKYRMSVQYGRRRAHFVAHYDLKFILYKGMRKVMPDVKKIIVKNGRGRKTTFRGDDLSKANSKDDEEQEIYVDYERGEVVYIIEVS